MNDVCIDSKHVKKILQPADLLSISPLSEGIGKYLNIYCFYLLNIIKIRIMLKKTEEKALFPNILKNDRFRAKLKSLWNGTPLLQFKKRDAKIHSLCLQNSNLHKYNEPVAFKNLIRGQVHNYVAPQCKRVNTDYRVGSPPYLINNSVKELTNDVQLAPYSSL